MANIMCHPAISYTFLPAILQASPSWQPRVPRAERERERERMFCTSKMIYYCVLLTVSINVIATQIRTIAYSNGLISLRIKTEISTTMSMYKIILLIMEEEKYSSVLVVQFVILLSW